MKREELIDRLRTLLEPDAHVHALWLEGADATGNLDTYSDIDICAAIDAEAIDSVFQALHTHLPIDSSYENRSEAERQLVFHVAGCDKYLVVDFNAYLSGVANTCFVQGDTIDVCKVLFDKDGTIRYRAFDPDDDLALRAYWDREGAYRISQICRVEKYCLRGNLPEAYAYYHKYVIEPLVFALRAKYTPTKMGYYLIHISRHIPDEERARLDRLLCIPDVDAIRANLPFAEHWYRQLKGG